MSTSTPYLDAAGIRLAQTNYSASKIGAGAGMITPQVELDVSGTQQFSTGNINSIYNNYYSNAPANSTYLSSVSPNTTLATISSSTWLNNGVSWTATASSNYSASYGAYNAFNNNYSYIWSSNNIVSNNYNSGTGAYTGSTTTTVQQVGTLYGEWLQIKSSIPLVLQSYQFATSSTIAKMPKTYTLVGSNDGNTWYPIHDGSIAAAPTASTNTLISTSIVANSSVSSGTYGSTTITTTTYPATSSNSYTYFRLITKTIGTGTGVVVVDISEWLPVFSAAIVTPITTSATSTSWVNNNITWTTNYSNANTPSNNWVPVTSDTNGSSGWQTGNYSGTNGAYGGSAKTILLKNGSTTTVTGDWLQIQSNIPLTMSSYILASAGAGGSIVSRMPGAYTIAGSNDGSTWYALQDVSFTVMPSSLSIGYTTNSIQTVNSIPVSTAVSNTVGTASSTSPYLTAYAASTNAYTYFRICVLRNLYNKFGLPNASAALQFQWRPYFLLTTAGPSRTLMYMDANNINQLDVSGSLALVNTNASSISIIPNYSTTPQNNTFTTNGVSWVASASSNNGTAQPSWSFYNGNAFTTYYGWQSVGNYSTGTYNGSVTTTNISQNGTIVSMNGEWLQIQSSIPLILNSYYLTAAGYPINIQNRIPASYSILGSNDGSTWYDLHDATFTANPGINTSGYTTPQNTPTYTVSTASTFLHTQNGNANITGYSASRSSYTYFRLIVKLTLFGLFGFNSDTQLTEFYWTPYFTSPSSSVSLSLDNGTVNQLNIGGGLGIAGSLNVNNIETMKMDTSTSSNILLQTRGGNVGIGTTNPAAKLDIYSGTKTSLIVRGSNGGYASSFPSHWSGGIATFDLNCSGIYYTTLTQGSDVRKKTDIITCNRGLNEIIKLRPVIFKWKPEFSTIIGDQFGFIAQEIEQVLPELVGEDNSGYKNITNSFIPIIVNSIQEQQTIIESQIQKIQELETIIATLESKLSTAGIA